MMNANSSSRKSTISLKKIFLFYIKTNRKRIVLTILFGALIFLVLTSFLMSWYNYRYDYFFNYMEENHDWLNDDQVSIHGNEYIHDDSILAAQYLTKCMQEVTMKLEELIPDIQKSHSGTLSFSLYRNITSYTHDSYTIQTFEENILSLISDNLIAGRMPLTTKELVYYKSGNEQKYNITDEVELFSSSRDSDYNNPINYTIVGIIRDLDAKLYNNGYSTDILKRNSFEWEPQPLERFFTTDALFYNILNTVENISTILNLGIDIDYKFSTDHILNINHYVNIMQNFWDERYNFDYLPSININFCKDLIIALKYFERDWQLKTISLIVASIPMVILLSVILIESANVNSHKQESIFRLLKTQGIKIKTLSKLLLLENILSTFSSFIIGFSTGLIVGLLLFKGMNLQQEVPYFIALKQPIILVCLLLSSLVYVALKAIYDYMRLKITESTVAAHHRNKRTKVIRKIFSFPEIICLSPGLVLTTVGLIILNVFSSDIYTYTMSQFVFILYLMTTIGILLLIVSSLIFLSRIMYFFWKCIGSYLWTKKKNYFTIALKQLSQNGSDYKRIMLATLVLGLCVIPGLTISNSVKLHAHVEASLTVGCSDLLINDWSCGDALKNNITNIEGIMYTTEIDILEFDFYKESSLQIEEFKIRLYSIQNITEFLNIIDLTILENDGLTEEDISNLNSNMSYLMSREYAHENNFDDEASFDTKVITDESYPPIEMNYINDFSYFPLLNNQNLKSQINIDTAPLDITQFDLIVSKTTAETILYHSSLMYNQDGFLLIKTNADSNLTRIQEDILEITDFSAVTQNQIEQQIIGRINDFTKIFLIISSIFSLIIFTILGYVYAVNISEQKQRIIDYEIQIGVKRSLIWGNISLEFLLAIILPLIISIGIALPLINHFSGFLLNVTQEFKIYSPWMPWWLIMLMLIGCLIVIAIGWFPKIIPQITKYKVKKME